MSILRVADNALTGAAAVRTGAVDAVSDDMRSWYTLVYGGMAVDHRIEHRYVGPGNSLRPSFHPGAESALRSAAAARWRHNVYVGMALRQAVLPGQVQRGRREDCAATRVLWCEYDLKHHGNILTVPLRHLESFGLPLSIIVFSGGGFHIQVLLADLIDLRQPGMADRVEAVNRHLAYALGGDVTVDNVGDLPRVLRPPASLNYKYKPPRPVELLHLEPACRYTLDEVEGWLRRYSPPPPQPQRHSTATKAPAEGSAAAEGSTAQGDVVTPWDDWLDRAPSWPQMLEVDGWHLHKTVGGVQYWTRPGKEARDGLSASLGYAGPGLLHVFTSSVKGLEQNGNYDRWAYEVAMRYGGDYGAAARAKAEEGFGTLGRYAKEHHGGDLSAAARDLTRQKYEAQRERGQDDRVAEAVDLITGERVIQHVRLRLSHGSASTIHTTYEKEDLHWSR